MQATWPRSVLEHSDRIKALTRANLELQMIHLNRPGWVFSVVSSFWEAPGWDILHIGRTSRRANWPAEAAGSSTDDKSGRLKRPLIFSTERSFYEWGNGQAT